jgi:GTP-binding protein HflX
VGFISHLPHKLVEAFRATLEETVQADLLLHVVDIANEAHDYYIEQVHEVLTEIGAEGIPCIQVLNKIDLMPGFEPRIDLGEDGKPSRVWVSARTGAGIDLLLSAISDVVTNDVVVKELALSPAQGRLRARLYSRGAVSNEAINDQGDTVLSIRLPRQDFERLLLEDGSSSLCDAAV